MNVFEVQDKKVAGGADPYETYSQMADRWSQEFRFSDIFDLGANMTNRVADRAAQKASDAFNMQEAQKQRDFEAFMDNTKYQRAVKDLQAAGFSPLALLQNAPSSAPSGSAASYSAGSKVRAKEKSSLGDLAALAIRVLGLLALKH